MNPTSRPMTTEIALSLFTRRRRARERDAGVPLGPLARCLGCPLPLLQAGREGLFDEVFRLPLGDALDVRHLADDEVLARSYIFFSRNDRLLRWLTRRRFFSTSATSVRRPVFILSRFCL